MKYVLFDFNGTILDDTDVSIKCENLTIKHFKLNRPELSKQEYLNIFTFPIKKYYENVGFDFNTYSFEEVGKYWFDCYESLKNEYAVFPEAIDFLKKSRNLGYQNILFSASNIDALKKQLKELNIEEYFDEVLGLCDIYAYSKEKIGLDFIADKNPDDCIMIGDTLHDYEVACKMNVKCYLIAKGHQSKEVLLSKCKDVYDDIRKVEL